VGRARTGVGLTAAAVGAVVLLAACGSGRHFADDPRPATPVDLTVYIDDSHVSISPAHVGAGPLILYVTNEASKSEVVSIQTSDGATVARSGAINSGQANQMNTDLTTPGIYDIVAGSTFPAKLKITRPRPNADNVLLQP
jgi:hypothetical protein